MMHITILQVLGRFNYSQVTFVIGGRRYSAKLVAQAMREHLEGSEGKRVEVALLAPESLVVELAETPDEAHELLERGHRFCEEVAERVRESELVSGDFKVLPVQSVGLHAGRGGGLTACFDNSLDNIVAYLLPDVIGLGMSGGSTLIADVSTGHNVYVAALLEAVRAALVYHKLRGLLQGKRYAEAQVSVAPPIRGPGEYDVGVYEYDVKAFFEFPLKPHASVSPLGLLSREVRERVRDTDLASRLVSELRGQCRLIRELVSKARVAFNAIKYNVPLALFHRELVDLAEVEPRRGLEALFEALNVIESERRVEVSGAELKVTRLRVDRPLVVNVALTMALLESIKEFWASEVAPVRPKLEYIEETFGELYERLGLGLNARFLSRDVRELLGQAGRGGVACSDVKRNFFAHSGLGRQQIEVEDSEVRYKEEALSVIAEWLRSPER